ncbi:MAG: two-component regulator propeller domain-containing protein [Calditrichia bacterium]
MTKSTESGENEICEFNFDENRWEKFIQTDEKKFFGALESENDFFFYGESGIIRFNPDLPDDQKIILYNENIDAPVLSALVNRDGTLWLGSFGYGAYRLSSITSRFLSYPPDASPENRWKSIRTIYVDPDGILWLGTYDGLYLIDREKNTISLKNIYEKNVSKEMQVVYSIYEDPVGNGDTLWLGIEGDDLIRLNRKTGEFKFFRVNSEDPNSVAGRVMTGIMRDKKGRLWVSTLNGVSRMKPESDQFDNYYHDPFDSSSLSSNQTICIMEDSQQRIWVGTISGLNQYLPESDSFRRYMYNPLQPGGLKPGASK